MRLSSVLFAVALLAACETAEPPLPPNLVAVEPATGPTLGVRFSLRGTGFVAGSRVWVGDSELTDLEISPTLVTGALSTRVAAGAQSVRISGETGDSERAGAYVANPWAVLSNEGSDDGGPVHGMLRHPETGQLYVWDHLALYRSDDDAALWQSVQRPGTHLFTYSMAAVPGAVLLGGHIVYRSEDSGASWTVPDYNPGAGASGSVFLASEGELVFAANGTVVSRSSDGGRTWANVGTLPHAARDAAFHAETGTLVCATNDGVYWSADEGATFSRATGPSGEILRAITAPGAATVWAASHLETFVSTDGGRTFVSAPIASASRAITDAALLPGVSERWVVAAGGVFAQTEDGLGWARLSTERAVSSVLPEASGDVLAGTEGGVRRLFADGAAPQILNTGMTTPEFREEFVDQSDGRLYLGTTSGAVISRGHDDTSWQLEAHAPESVIHLAVSRTPEGARSFYAGWSQLWQLDLEVPDGTWVAPLPSTPVTVAVSASGEDTVAVAGGLWKRHLAGPWEELTTIGLENGSPHELRWVNEDLYALVRNPEIKDAVFHLAPQAVAWTPVSAPVTITTGDGTTVFEIADGAFFAGRGEQVFRYVPGAPGWEPADPSVDFIAGMAVDPSDRRQVYSAGGTLRKSSDSGATWRDLPLVPDGYSHSVVVDGHHPGRVYFIGYQTVLMTDSGGE